MKSKSVYFLAFSLLACPISLLPMEQKPLAQEAQNALAPHYCVGCEQHVDRDLIRLHACGHVRHIPCAGARLANGMGHGSYGQCPFGFPGSVSDKHYPQENCMAWVTPEDMRLLGVNERAIDNCVNWVRDGWGAGREARNKRDRKIILGVVGILVIGGGYALYRYFAKPKAIKDEESQETEKSDVGASEKSIQKVGRAKRMRKK